MSGATLRRSAGVSMSRSVRRRDREAPDASGMTRSSRPRSAPAGGVPGGEQARGDRDGRLRDAGPSAAGGPDRVVEDDGVDPAASSAASIAASDRRDERRHVAADDEDGRAGRLARPGSRPASGPSKATRSWIDADRRGQDRRAVRRATTTRTSSHNGRTASIGVVEQRPAVDRLGQLVATEPARSAAGEDDRP